MNNCKDIWTFLKKLFIDKEIEQNNNSKINTNIPRSSSLIKLEYLEKNQKIFFQQIIQQSKNETLDFLFEFD